MRFLTFFVTQDREHPVYLSIHNKFSLKTDTLVLASSNSPIWFRPLACENCLLPILFVNEEKNSLLTRSVYVIWSTFFTFHNSLQCFFRVDSSSHSRIFANKLRLQSSPVLWRIFDPLVTEPTFIGTSFYTDLLGRKKSVIKMIRCIIHAIYLPLLALVQRTDIMTSLYYLLCRTAKQEDRERYAFSNIVEEQIFLVFNILVEATRAPERVFGSHQSYHVSIPVSCQSKIPS